MAKKKGLIYRLTMGKDNLPDFTPDRLPGNRFSQFKDIFFGRMGAMFKINLLILLFALPTIVMIILNYMRGMIVDTMLPYSGNIGFGYPIVTGTAELAKQVQFSNNITLYGILVLTNCILSLGLAGAFSVMKRLVWGEGIQIGSHFFRGIKQNWFPFVLSSVVLSISLFFVLFNFDAYSILDMHMAFKVMGIGVSVLTLFLLVSMAIFMFTQAVTYKLKFWPLLKNSFLFSIALFPINLFILVCSLAPFIIAILLMSIPMIGVMILVFVLMLGISYVVLMWTVYAHWAFDKFLNDKVEGAVKNRGMYVKNKEDELNKEKSSLLAKNTRFNNPVHVGKKISSIDEGLTFTPLSEGFSRKDLEQLAEEKEAVKNEIDLEYGDLVEEEVVEEEIVETMSQEEKDRIKKQFADRQQKAKLKVTKKK